MSGTKRSLLEDSNPAKRHRTEGPALALKDLEFYFGLTINRTRTDWKFTYRLERFQNKDVLSFNANKVA